MQVKRTILAVTLSAVSALAIEHVQIDSMEHTVDAGKLKEAFLALKLGRDETGFRKLIIGSPKGIEQSAFVINEQGLTVQIRKNILDKKKAKATKEKVMRSGPVFAPATFPAEK